MVDGVGDATPGDGKRLRYAVITAAARGTSQVSLQDARAGQAELRIGTDNIGGERDSNPGQAQGKS